MEDKDKPVEEPVIAEESEKSTATAGAGKVDSEPADESPQAAPEIVETQPLPQTSTRSRGGRGLALVAMLLAAIALGVSAWLYYSARMGGVDHDVLLQARLGELQSDFSSRERKQEEESHALQLSLQREMANLQQTQSTELESLRKIVQQQRRRLLDLGSADRSDWMLAEVEYLLRLAHQRMVMAGDVVSARALMSSADEIVRSLDDASLHDLRAAIASDLAALRAVPGVDVEGTWLRIQALVGQVDELILFEFPDQRPELESAPQEGTMGQRLTHGLGAALNRLKSYIVIKRRDEPYRALIDPQWEGLVRQNMRMLLEQSRSALLSGNQLLYSQSLENARRWLGEFFSFNESGVAALDAELASLAEIGISPELPDITASLAAAKLAIDDKHNVVPGGQ